ncbi:MAG: DUF4926 domain-containing protein, partial [Okeania sp. SIO4D6]|nr:DUF4926 domain-containing protein [Okeania sp. SIO4D6]
KAFEVEFCDPSGRTYELLGLQPEKFMVLYFAPVSRAYSSFQVNEPR